MIRIRGVEYSLKERHLDLIAVYLYTNRDVLSEMHLASAGELHKLDRVSVCPEIIDGNSVWAIPVRCG